MVANGVFGGLRRSAEGASWMAGLGRFSNYLKHLRMHILLRTQYPEPSRDQQLLGQRCTHNNAQDYDLMSLDQIGDAWDDKKHLPRGSCGRG